MSWRLSGNGTVPEIVERMRKSADEQKVQDNRLQVAQLDSAVARIDTLAQALGEGATMQINLSGSASDTSIAESGSINGGGGRATG